MEGTHRACGDAGADDGGGACDRARGVHSGEGFAGDVYANEGRVHGVRAGDARASAVRAHDARACIVRPVFAGLRVPSWVS